MDTTTQLTSHEDVCTQLDELVLEYLRLIDTHLNAMAAMTKHLQEGREQIAQAKYIMGPRNVSSECYDNRMKALRGLRITEDGKATLMDTSKEMQQTEKSQDQGCDTGPDDMSIEHGGLRRRGGGTSDLSNASSGTEVNAEAPGADDSSDTEAQEKKEKKKEASRDPLRWFSVFAPAPLRNAQNSFRRGLEDMSELMTIRLQLLAIERQIRTLEQRKTDLLPMVA
ncbi:hypothetical protein BGZ73_005926 [Actinomortierella ambigua]|nr:hypothetical protein BGZ73_005926 [Actinomortierella ambigua]